MQFTQTNKRLYVEPHAKINLGLLIKGKRADGYHLLETLLYPLLHLRDKMRIEISGSPGCAIELTGIALDGDPSDNLCVKAYQALEKKIGALPGINIHLEKHIPAGAGLGGGSSNAAFTLRGINELLELGLDKEVLSEIAAGLGADVPFFLYDEPMLASGIGTELELFPIELPYEIRLITPPIHSSTVAAYKALDYRQFDPNRSLAQLLREPVLHWAQCLVNDLEVPVFQLIPELAEIKRNFYKEGAVYACMSGSGSAVFALFEK